MSRWYLLAGALTVTVALCGCGGGSSAAKTTTGTGKGDPATLTTAKADGNDHDHHAPGPHGGVVFDWGKYHAEFTVDHDKKTATVYILKANMKSALAIKGEKMQIAFKAPAFNLELKPMPGEGDPMGSSSRYVGTDPRLGVKQEFAGTLIGTVGDKVYQDDFAEEAEHDHGKK